MNLINGNILDIKKGIICQQVNCMGVMGAGLALQIRKKWPIVYETYMKAHRSGELRLGNIIYAPTNTINVGELRLSDIIHAPTNTINVANLCSQYYYGRDKRYTNYEALCRCLEELNRQNLPIYIPYGMGCVLAGGNWKVVTALIECYCDKATIVKL